MASEKTRAADVSAGIRIEWFSTGWMVVEAATAVTAGVSAHSIALVAFGADSVIEIVASAVLLWRLYVEARGEPAEKIIAAEPAASWVVGIALLALGLYIVVASVHSLWNRSGATTSALGIGITVTSSILMPFLARAKKRIARRIGSKSLESDGSCSMVCAYMAWIVLAGVLATALLGWWWLDFVAALGLVYFVVHEGGEAIGDARNTRTEDGAP